MKRIISFLIPPPRWRLIAVIVMGAGFGITLYLFVASNAVSYLSDEPKTCVNCHVMQPQYATWFHSSHREVAHCNDCHVPHDNMFNKYLFKAKDGMRHASVFTMRKEPQVIIIKDEGLKVVQENCKRCHLELNQEAGLLDLTGEKYLHGDGKLCWSCHREVPHGRVNSLSSTPNALVPLPESIIPDWMNRNETDKKTDQ